MPQTEKTFYNYYKKQNDKTFINYTLQKGFKTLEEAKEIIFKKWNPNLFTYISVNNEIYAVAIETLGKQIIITKQKCYYRNGISDLNGFSGKENFCDFKEYNKIPTEIIKPRISSPWKNEVKKDLEKLFDIKILNNVKGKYLEENSIILLAHVLFDTMVPVFKLGVMDAYFSDDSNSPSRWKLWEEGIKSYNYYTNEKEYSEYKPYTFEDYIKEINK